MNLAGLTIVLGALALAAFTMPYGLAIIAVLIWLYMLG